MLHDHEANDPIVCNCYKGSIFPHKSLFDQDMVYLSIAEKTSKTLHNVELWLSLLSCGTHLTSFFTLPIFLWSDIIEILASVAWDISLVFRRGFCSTGVFRCWSSIVNGRHLTSLFSRFVSSLRNFWNQRLTVRSQVNPSYHALSILGYSMKGIMNKLETMQKKSKRITSFFLGGGDQD